jgi:hypothetical protein
MAAMDLPFALHQQSVKGSEGESVADFGLAQAEASQRAIRTADQTCLSRQANPCSRFFKPRLVPDLIISV